MEAYIDLSIIVFLFNYIISFVYSIILFDNVKYRIRFIVSSILLSTLFAIINTLFIPYFFILASILYGLFVGIFSIRYLKTVFLTLFLYYINTAFLLIIGGCFLYQGILLISTPFVSLFILLEPLYITIIHIITSNVIKYYKYKDFKMRCIIQIDERIIKGKGYYDSGNCLLYDDKPVIFIKGMSTNNNGEIIKISGINDYSFSYLAYKAMLTIKKKQFAVYVVFVGNNMNFNNCEFLLNKYII